MEMVLVKMTYKVFVALSDLKLLLLWDDKDGKIDYTSIKFMINQCKNKIDDIINLIEKDCNKEKE